MKIYIKGHTFGYELQRVAQMFFPGEKVEVSQGEPDEETLAGDYLVTCAENSRLTVSGSIGESRSCRCEEPILQTDAPSDLEHKLGVMIYRVASQATGIYPQWGVLTGIRPVKLFLSRMEQGMDEAELRTHFLNGCLVNERKFDLALKTARIEREILAKSTSDSFSLYISIPFCPTRCAYCSFVSHSIEQAAKLIPAYVGKLCEELADTARIAAQLKLKLRTVYFGGGTPTTLSAQQLERIMGTIAAQFDFSGIWEYTVEAGRPDTITADKLREIKEAGAGRISINPQTLSDSVLEVIGRKHTTRQLMDVFAMARDYGFDNINMDLIAGLPTDTPEGFKASIDGVIAMAPENITVHTLTVKRASRITFEQACAELQTVGGMVDYAQEAVTAAGYAPYYLYRQNGSLSSLENVGYAKPGTEGLYNIYIMDETHSILGVGAGASTKLRHPVTGAFERIYNYKYPYEYMQHFEAAKERKQRILEFYR
ncbi:coproporphyrinogen dehydrogenase HemZ [Oscillospiraceae bacterium PP1C4]